MSLLQTKSGASRRDTKAYVAPSLRQLTLREEENFLISTGGEDADPQPGTWVMGMEEDLF